MSTGPDILLTNPCGRTGEIIRKDLEAKGLAVAVMEGPNARKMTPAYLRALEKEILNTGPRMVVPVFFPEILAGHRDLFPGVRIPLDDAAKIRRLDNKTSACALAAESGVPQPRMWQSPDEVDTYPLVFKRPEGQGGDSVYFPKTPQALRNLMRTAPSGVILQEFIEGTDVCVDCLRWDGFFHAAAYRVLEPRMKGVSTLRESVEAGELGDYCRRMLDAVDYHGVCGFDFRVSETDGKAYFLECNPRFSGGIESALAVGFDIPWLYYRLALGEKVSETEIPPLETGVRTGSYLSKC